MTDTQALTVEQRLELIEARLTPEPLAVVPPITIGSLTNVPAPGAQIAAQWAQDATGMLVHRFASLAAIQTWAAPNGTYAHDIATGFLHRRVAGQWSQVTPWAGAAGGVALDSVNNATVATLNIPIDQGPRFADISCFLRIDVFSGNSVTIDLRLDGATQTQAVIPATNPLGVSGANMLWNISLRAAALAVPTGRVVPVSVVITTVATTPGSYHTVATAPWNRVDAVVAPRGF